MAGAVVIFFAAALCYGLSLFTALGAHPLWATQVLIVGALIAMTLHAVLRPRVTAKFAVMIVVCLVAYGVATYGKTAFAASYAEDAFAGQLWFFGWHVAAATGFATIGALAQRAAQLMRA